MKTLYIDMDNVLVDFQSGIDSISEEERTKFKNDLDDDAEKEEEEEEEEK